MFESENQGSELELPSDTILTVKRLYTYWMTTRTQCTPGNKGAKLCGDLGTRLAEEWVDSFPTFCNWALRHGANPKSGVERVNRGKNFNPENCRVVQEIAVQTFNRKFTDKKLLYQVESICDNTYMSDYDIGKLYGTSGPTIKAVRFGTHWNSGPGAKVRRARPSVAELVPMPSVAELVRPGPGSRRISRLERLKGWRGQGCRTLPDKRLIHQIEDVCDQTDLTYVGIAKIYGVSPQTIRKVDFGEHWNSGLGRAVV